MLVQRRKRGPKQPSSPDEEQPGSQHGCREEYQPGAQVIVLPAKSYGELIQRFHNVMEQFRQRSLDVHVVLASAATQDMVDKKLEEWELPDEIRLKYEVLQELRDVNAVCTNVLGEFGHYNGDPELIKPLTQLALSLVRSLDRTIYKESLSNDRWTNCFQAFIKRWGSLATWKKQGTELFLGAVGVLVTGGAVVGFMLIPGLILLAFGVVSVLLWKNKQGKMEEIDGRVLRELRSFKEVPEMMRDKERLGAVLQQMKSIEKVGQEHWQYFEPNNEYEECLICKDEAASSLCVPSGCKHVFHTNCLRAWGGFGCPNCRKPYLKIFELTCQRRRGNLSLQAI